MNCTIDGVQYKQGVHNKIFMFINGAWVRSTMSYKKLVEAVTEFDASERERLLLPPTSKQKGVEWCKVSCSWHVWIHYGKRKTELGYYVDEEKAIKVRLEAEVKRKGRVFRLLNPKGELVEFTNLTNFSKENGLTQGNVSSVINGRAEQHKQWRLPPQIKH